MTVKDILNKCKEKGVEIRFKYFPDLNWFRIRITKRDAFSQEYVKDYVFCPDDIVKDGYLEEAIDRIIEYVVRISQE